MHLPISNHTMQTAVHGADRTASDVKSDGNFSHPSRTVSTSSESSTGSVFEPSDAGPPHAREVSVRVQVVDTLGICPSPRESATMCWTPDGAVLFGTKMITHIGHACLGLLACRTDVQGIMRLGLG